MNKDSGILEVAIGNGTPLLLFVSLMLILSGLFALFQAATGHFLPHDVAYLGLKAAELCEFYGCRIVGFMIHDRTAFGGALVAVGMIYFWLVSFPLKNREAWAWWALVLSGTAGFISFLTYLGYGYLDSWHGLATLLLLSVFGGGLFKSRAILSQPNAVTVLKTPAFPFSLKSSSQVGRSLLLLVTFGMIAGGFTMMMISISRIFVPQDLAFMQVTIPELHDLNARLVSLIAHDRAGFGGAIFSTGIAAFLALWCAPPSKSLWQTLLVSGIFGFGCAIGTHYVVGYIDFVHLAPAYLGALLFATGLILSYDLMVIMPLPNTPEITPH